MDLYYLWIINFRARITTKKLLVKRKKLSSLKRDLELLNLLAQGIPVHSQDEGSLDLVSICLLKGQGDEWPFDLLEQESIEIS